MKNKRKMRIFCYGVDHMNARKLSTDAKDYSDLSEGKTLPIGVGLREGEIKYLDEIALENSITRHAILHYAVRSFLIDYRAGNIDLKPMLEAPQEPKMKLRLPE